MGGRLNSKKICLYKSNKMRIQHTTEYNSILDHLREMEMDTYFSNVTMIQTNGLYLLNGLPWASDKTYALVSSSVNEDNSHTNFIRLL